MAHRRCGNGCPAGVRPADARGAHPAQARRRRYGHTDLGDVRPPRGSPGVAGSRPEPARPLNWPLDRHRARRPLRRPAHVRHRGVTRTVRAGRNGMNLAGCCGRRGRWRQVLSRRASAADRRRRPRRAAPVREFARAAPKCLPQRASRSCCCSLRCPRRWWRSRCAAPERSRRADHRVAQSRRRTTATRCTSPADADRPARRPRDRGGHRPAPPADEIPRAPVSPVRHRPDTALRRRAATVRRATDRCASR